MAAGSEAYHDDCLTPRPVSCGTSNFGIPGFKVTAALQNRENELRKAFDNQAGDLPRRTC